MTGFNGGRARTRLSLFAGGSLAVVSIIGAGGVLLAPTQVLAYDECVPANPPTTLSDGPGGAFDVTLNGATADSFACSGTLPSIAYPSTSGALTLTLTNGVAVTSGGLSANATDGSTITIARSDATVDGGDPSIANTGGAGIQATTTTGALTVNLSDADTGDAALSVTGTTRGALLQTASTTASALTLTMTNGSIAATGAGGIGIEAISNSLGAGNVQLTVGSVSGAIGIKGTSSGTGGLNVTLAPGSATVGGDVVGTSGPAILLTPNANAGVVAQAGRTIRASNAGGAVIEFTNVNATRSVSATANGGGAIRPNDTSAAGYDDLAVLVGGGAGNATVSSNAGGSLVQGRVSLLNTGNAAINVRVSSFWRTSGASVVGLGASTGALNMEVSSQLVAATNAVATTIAYGDGVDTFNNTGGIIAVGGGVQGAATLTISGLDVWTNSGTLRFGVDDTGNADSSDRVGNDRISAGGAAVLFTGATSSSGATLRSSRMVMDVDLGASQADCLAAVTADCLDLRGGTVAGTTSILLNTVGVGPAASRIVLIDVAGAGTSAASRFTIDPKSPGLRDVGGVGGVFDGGLFLYGLSYDTTAKQHVLTPMSLDGDALEFALLGQAAGAAWETTTGGWLTRQADLRGSLAGRGDGSAPGAWLKIAGNFVEDGSTQTYAFGADTLDYDTTHAQETTAIVGGVDLVSLFGEGTAFVAGLTGGSVRSELNVHESETDVTFEGASYGAYASYLGGGFFVDAIVNATKLDTEYSAPAAGLANVQGEVESLGYQVEGGLRLPINDGAAYVEPLATLAYVKTDLSDLTFSNVVVEYDEITSFRGALGVRLAGDMEMEAMTAQFSLTGRVWQEFEGVNTAAIRSSVASFDLVDDTAATVGDVAVALSLFAGERFSANLAYGVRFKEDYQSTDASLSLRFNW